MSDINTFIIKAKIFSSTFLVPNDWPVYDILDSSYDCTREDGTAKMNVDVTSSSFTFNH